MWIVYHLPLFADKIHNYELSPRTDFIWESAMREAASNYLQMALSTPETILIEIAHIPVMEPIIFLVRTLYHGNENTTGKHASVFPIKRPKISRRLPNNFTNCFSTTDLAPVTAICWPRMDVMLWNHVFGNMNDWNQFGNVCSLALCRDGILCRISFFMNN